MFSTEAVSVSFSKKMSPQVNFLLLSPCKMQFRALLIFPSQRKEKIGFSPFFASYAMYYSFKGTKSDTLKNRTQFQEPEQKNTLSLFQEIEKLGFPLRERGLKKSLT